MPIERQRWPWIALCLSLLACSDDQPVSVLLTVQAQPPANPSFLRFWLYDDDGRSNTAPDLGADER